MENENREIIKDNGDIYIGHMYDDWSEDKLYAYMVYELKEDGDEEYVEMRLNKSLVQMIDLVSNGIPYEIKQDDDFADWFHVFRDDDKHFRIQLFQ